MSWLKKSRRVPCGKSRRSVLSGKMNEIRPAIQPLMPPRKAHLAMLIAAGLINNQILEANGKRLLIKGTSKKAIDRFEEETEKGIKITERERIVTQINAFDLNTGEYLQIV